MPSAETLAPWTKRPDWAAGRISGSNPFAACAIMWGFAIVWCLMFGLASWSILTRHYMTIRHQGEMPIVFQGLFGIGMPLLGPGLVMTAISMTRRALRFGRSVLVLDAVPGVPGGTLSGCIDCAVSPQLDAAFDLKLSCSYTWSSGSGKNRMSQTEVLWSDEYECAGERAADAIDRSSIPVRFDIPAHAEPAGPYQRGEILWTLSVSSKLPGVDYADDFQVPVFAGATPTPVGAARDLRKPPEAIRHPVHGRARLEESGDTLQVVFPPAMNPEMAYMGSVCLCMAGWMSWAFLAHDEVIGAVIAAAAALPFLYLASRAWLMRTTVTVSPASFAIERSLLFFTWRRDLDPRQIRDITAASSGQSGNDQLYKLKVLHHQGQSGFGSLLRSRSEAEHIRTLMLAHLRSQGESRTSS